MITANLIEKHLETLFAKESPLYDSARYVLFASAKRLRPLLVLKTLECFDVDTEKGLSPACALEIIHTYSLIHDDLPCIDDDDLRRGKPTLHTLISDGHALLTGDFLLTYAFEVIANAPYLSPQKIVSLISCLAKRAGGEGMVEGQEMDISLEEDEINPTVLHEMQLKKTGALIIAALEFGGIIGGATQEEILLLNKCGTHLGVAFQIQDDILDVIAEEEELGKPIGSDEMNDKVTAVTLYGLAEARLLLESHFEEAFATLALLERNTNELCLLLQSMHRRSQ